MALAESNSYKLRLLRSVVGGLRRDSECCEEGEFYVEVLSFDFSRGSQVLVCVTPLFAIACTPSEPIGRGESVSWPMWTCPNDRFLLSHRWRLFLMGLFWHCIRGCTGRCLRAFRPDRREWLQCVENSGAITLELAEYAAGLQLALSLVAACGKTPVRPSTKKSVNCSDNSN